MENTKIAILSQNVDIKEGVIFVKKGQFYGEEVFTKYPELFEINSSEVEKIVEIEEAIEVPKIIEEVEETVNKSTDESEELAKLEEELKALEESTEE